MLYFPGWRFHVSPVSIPFYGNSNEKVLKMYRKIIPVLLLTVILNVFAATAAFTQSAAGTDIFAAEGPHHPGRYRRHGGRMAQNDVVFQRGAAQSVV